MSQVLPIRPDMAMSADAPASAPAPAKRVLLLLEPGTPRSVANDALGVDDYDLRIETFAAGMPPLLAGIDALIVEVDPTERDAFARFESFAREHAVVVPVIAAVRDLTVAKARQVMRVGVADVLPLPFTTEDVTGALAHAHAHPRPLEAKPPVAAPLSRGKIVSFLGALGGCGTTTLATQAGIAWAANASVCLIDFDVQFGNAALYLDLRPSLSIADVIEAGERLDPELLRSIAIRHASGVSVIAAPTEMVPLDTLSVELVQETLTLAAQAFDIVLIDLPAAWTNWSLRVIELSDIALLVTSLSVPGIHQARRQADVIDANGLGDRLRVVVNRVAHPMFGKLDLSETQALLGRKIDYTIANDYPTVSGAIDQGKPFSAIKAKSRVEKDLRAMVGGLSATLVGAVG